MRHGTSGRSGQPITIFPIPEVLLRIQSATVTITRAVTSCRLRPSQARRALSHPSDACGWFASSSSTSPWHAALSGHQHARSRPARSRCMAAARPGWAATWSRNSWITASRPWRLTGNGFAYGLAGRPARRGPPTPRPPGYARGIGRLRLTRGAAPQRRARAAGVADALSGRASAAGTLPCPANAHVVPVRPAGGSAGGLPGRAGDADR